MFLNQRKFVQDIIADTRMINARSTDFPFQKGLKLDKGTGEVLPDPEQYKRLIGHFLYLGMTRLDIKYFTRQLNQYMQPRKPHLQVALDVSNISKDVLKKDNSFLLTTP